MDELLAVLDALADQDLSSTSGPALLERERALLVAQNKLGAELARTTGQCELTQAPECDGLTSMQSWLRGHGHLAPAEAIRPVRTGRALESLPATAAAFAAGSVTAGQAAVTAVIAEPQHTAAAAAQGRRPR